MEIYCQFYFACVIYVHVCAHLWVCRCTGVCKGQKLLLAVFNVLYLSRQDFMLNLELTNWASLASQHAPCIPCVCLQSADMTSLEFTCLTFTQFQASIFSSHSLGDKHSAFWASCSAPDVITRARTPFRHSQDWHKKPCSPLVCPSL